MMFLYAIFCQWFSRGCLLKCCLEQDKWEMLVIAFLVGFAIGSPVQGYMSDKGSRKKILLVTILCVIISMLIIVVGNPFCPTEKFPILLIAASVINGVFGNVFPVATAAYAEKIHNDQGALKLSFLCRYGAMVLPFILQFPHYYSFLVAFIINQVSLIIIAYKFTDKKVLSE